PSTIVVYTLSLHDALPIFSLARLLLGQAAELSGMAQSFGYLLAAMSPMFFGHLYDLTNSWTIPLLILIGASLLLFIAGPGAARKDRKSTRLNSSHLVISYA